MSAAQFAVVVQVPDPAIIVIWAEPVPLPEQVTPSEVMEATVLALVLGSCAMQAGVQGAWGVIPAHINELSPPSVRGLFPGFVYQLGFLIASPATMVELRLRHALGYSWAFTVFEGAVIVALLFLFYFGPEERGKDFSSPQADPA